MAINNTQSGTRPFLTSAVTGSTPVSNVAFEAAVAAAIVQQPAALDYAQRLLPAAAPSFMNRGGLIDHSSIVPTEFCYLYSQILGQDQHRL